MDQINSTESAVRFDSVEYSIDGVTLLGPLDLEIRRGEIVVILGESGCGKTTTLKLINGLLAPTSGSVSVDGKSTSEWDLIQLRRRIGYVLQDGGLFPHMTVRQNAGIAIYLQGTNASEIDSRVDEMLRLVRLDPQQFGDRLPHEISGGQRQRVGVARALVPDPDLLLLDEPFGALDAITRSALQTEFASLVRNIGKTVVFVTHDLQEALLLGSRIILLDHGKVALDAIPEAFRRSDIPLAKAYLNTILTNA